MKEPVVVPFARVAFPREEEVFTMRVPTFKLPVLVAFVKTVLPRELEVFTVSTVIVVVAREEVPVTEKVWVEELKVICVAPPKPADAYAGRRAMVTRPTTTMAARFMGGEANH